MNSEMEKTQECQSSKVTEGDLLIFLQFYFVTAKDSIDSLLSNISLVKSHQNFWLNFVLNFKDTTLVNLILSNVDTEKTNHIMTKLKDILSRAFIFIKDNLSSQEAYELVLKDNMYELMEMILRFYELFENIRNSQLKFLIEDSEAEVLLKCFKNYSTYTQVNLLSLKEVFYGRIGYAFVDFKGNFIWADKFTTDVLFEQAAIDKLNLFEKMTDFSKYIIRNKYGTKFFDFKDEKCRIREFTYSIYLPSNEKNQKDAWSVNLFDIFKSTKTLFSRASAILIQNPGDLKSNACIMLETKHSPFRQNFDYFHWRKFIE